MNGNEVYRFATRTMGTVAQQALQKAGLTLEQVDLLIPHQANLRIIQSAAKAAQAARREGLCQPGPLRQHLGCVDPDCSVRGRGQRAGAAGTHDCAGGLRRRADLGSGCGALAAGAAGS